MNKKKISALSLLLVLSLLLAACSSSKTDNSKETDSAKETDTPVSSPVSNSEEENHWSYEGETGPEHWGDLDPANLACVNGTEQSPINIETTETEEKADQQELTINYVPTTFSLENNGHTIQANPAASDNSIVLGNDTFHLAQLHFHTPSEHQFNGNSFDMELHLVHKNEKDELAVLGLMIKEGKESSILKEAWESMPKEQTTEDVQLKQQIDLTNILPTNQDSFRYNGSLTTPSCAEGVKWIVLEEPIEMSKEQIERFQAIFPENSRPVQKLNEREVLKY
ncbi:carbonic anhydrase [Metabacillus fastidiosus]|uniref:carbonic anhydrase n=1 Tax=Metabacillus fastidiosus TaxID=1458 RepID=UPI003D2C1B4E